MSVRFEQLSLEPAYRKVASAIGERILDRRLQVGDRLPPELELARQFGVNRSTVREALRELESHGLVIRRPGSRRLAVSRPQHRVVAEGISRALVLHDVTFLEVWEGLTILEPPIAEAAARTRSPDDVRAIAAAADLFASHNRKAVDAARHVGDFFRAIARATHNQVLGLAQEPLLGLLDPSLRLMIDEVPQARSRIVTAQARLLEALQARDGEAARIWMSRHIRDFRKGFELARIALDQPIGD